MSSKIEEINETLRKFANAGFDISNNRGIVLGGKLFPANFKQLELPSAKNADFKSTKHYRNVLHNTRLEAHIPFESGNVAFIEHDFLDDNKTSTSLYLKHPLMYKTSYTKPDGWEHDYGSSSAKQGLYSYGTEHDKDSHPIYMGDPPNGEHIIKVPQINNNTDWDSLHKQIAEFSKMASFGKKVVDRESYAMNPSDYMNHSVNISTDKNNKHHKPHVIRMGQFEGSGKSEWNYDLNTEQLMNQIHY